MSRLSCGGENHPRCTRAARAARRAPVAPRAPRPRSARNGDRREDARRGRQPATGRASRRARVWGVSCSRRGGGRLHNLPQTYLEACLKRAVPVATSTKWRSESIHPAGRAAEQFEVSAGYSSRSTRRRYDQNDATGPWNGYMAQKSRVAGKKVQIYLELASTPRRRTARLWGPGSFGARYMGPNPLTDRCG